MPLSPWQAAADPCLRRRPSTLTGRSGPVSCGATVSFTWVLMCTRFCLYLQRVESLFPKSCGGPFCCSFSFVLGCGVSFFGGFQCLPFNSCSTTSCSFSALVGEGEHRSFYSTILNQSLLQKIPINAKYLPLLAKHSNYRSLGLYSLTFQVVCSLSQ